MAVAPGRIVVSDGTKLIQPLEASVVKVIHVKDGDKVKAGQVLIELDATAARADNTRVTQDRVAALSEAWRTRALLDALDRKKAPALPQDTQGSDPVLVAQAQRQLLAEWADIQAQDAKLAADIQARQAELATVREQVAKLKATLPLLEKREADFDALSRQGFVSQHAGQDRTRPAHRDDAGPGHLPRPPRRNQGRHRCRPSRPAPPGRPTCARPSTSALPRPTCNSANWWKKAPRPCNANA